MKSVDHKALVSQPLFNIFMKNSGNGNENAAKVNNTK